MYQWLPTLLCGFASYLIARTLTPWAMRLAPCIGAIDTPRDGRRMHSRPIPRTGGLAMFAAFVLCISATGSNYHSAVALLAGGTLIVLLGLFDDVYRLPAPLKLIVQLIASAVALGHGTGAARSRFSAPLGLVIGMLYLTLLINAHNMIDGLDGLAAGVGSVEAIALALIFGIQGSLSDASLALVLAGCALGFLHRNRHPADIFMGDAGSQLIGYVLGVLSLRIELSVAPLGVLSLALLFALPLSDLGFAVVRRVLRGQSPFAADRGHWHHRLVDAGLSQRQACSWLCMLSALCAAAGVLLRHVLWYPFAVYTLLAALGLVMLLDLRLRRPARQ